ncbi:hypothetical protein KO488_00675 [Poseidonibacter lekithochrous]|uniref:hypothetical protein n=1 Tax=Poseidonibacter TaxID=2321187 RepID=UPI001C08F783|nr:MULTISPECIES: hypothetical protein [Poseidonibacter]MBU3013250.1 hypothetical protein [Poseidonibacter lekithochrous]MDO6826547.1 hypothetical protein [Poseidonibacter sp. 1_MG-2023]
MDINKYFSKVTIINNLAKYETYYQVALGILVSATNTKKIDSDIKLEYALGSIYELIKDLENEKNLESIFNIELQKQSAMDAVQYFANENIQAVKNKELDIENTINKINDNLFFNDLVLDICKENEKNQITKWENIITNEIADAIMNSLLDLEKK